MILSNYRMVEGQPLQYYNPYYVSPPPRPDQFPYFQRFDPYYRRMESSEELLLPSSPNSVQSDSDNSLSSVEISPKRIGSTGGIMKSALKAEVQCRWQNCGIPFPSLDQLATHVSKVHASSGPGGLFYCGWEGCLRNNKGFNARYKMLVHVRTHTNEKPHKCFQCDKSFSRAENLKIHSRSHSGEKPYVCPVPGCNKAYSNSSDRFKHTRTHQVEKPYQCKVPGCPKRYTDPSSLRKHVKTYKHFLADSVVDEKKQADVSASDIITTAEVQTIDTDERMDVHPNIENSYRENVIRHPCHCSQACCVPKGLDRATEFMRLGAFINLKNEEANLGWKRFIDPYIPEPKKLFAPYEDCNQENMKIDVPLDLSIHSKGY